MTRPTAARLGAAAVSGVLLARGEAAARRRAARVRRVRPAVRRVARPTAHARPPATRSLPRPRTTRCSCRGRGTSARSRSCRSSRRSARTGRARARSSDGCASRGIANPFLTAAVWVLAEATVARVPARRVLVGRGRLRVPQHRSGPRAGERRWRRAGHVLRGRAQRLPRRRHRERPGSVRSVGRGVVATARVGARGRSLILPLVAVAARSEPRPAGHAAGRDHPGQRQEP